MNDESCAYLLGPLVSKPKKKMEKEMQLALYSVLKSSSCPLFLDTVEPVLAASWSILYLSSVLSSQLPDSTHVCHYSSCSPRVFLSLSLSLSLSPRNMLPMLRYLTMPSLAAKTLDSKAENRDV